MAIVIDNNDGFVADRLKLAYTGSPLGLVVTERFSYGDSTSKSKSQFSTRNYLKKTGSNQQKGQGLSTNPLSFDTLAKAVSGSINFTQAFGLSKVLGAGFGTAQTIGVVAALIPTVVSGVSSAFEPNNSQAKYTGGNTTEPVNNFMQGQATLARQSALMRAGLNVV